MQLTVNGEQREVDDLATVTTLVAALALPDRGVAVAVDDAVVPKARWATTTLLPHQRVEVLTAVQGG